MVLSLNRASRSGTPPPQNLPAPASEVDPLKQQLGDGSAPRFKRLPSHGTNIGRRKSLRADAAALVSQAPDIIREELTRHFPASSDGTTAETSHAREFAQAIMRGVRGGDRTCLHLYPQLIGMLGAQSEFTTSLLNALGVSLEVARGAVEAHKRSAPLVTDRKALVAEAERMLAEHYRDDPAACYRSPLRAVLFRAVEPAGAAAAATEPVGGAPGRG